MAGAVLGSERGGFVGRSGECCPVASGALSVFGIRLSVGCCA